MYLLQNCASRAESETVTHILWNIWMSSRSINASRSLKEGLNHLSRGNTKQAISCLHHAISCDPTLTEAYSKLAAIESTEKHPVTSLKYSLQTLQHISCHYGAHATTGISLLSMTKSVNSVRYQDAVKSLTESLDENPWSGWLATKLILLRTSPHRKIESVVKRKPSNHVVRIVSVSEDANTSTDEATVETIEPIAGTDATESLGPKKGTLIEFDIIEEGERREGQGKEGKEEPDEDEKRKDE
jgi:tetratricopeptide (TPR) repeat protein